MLRTCQIALFATSCLAQTAVWTAHYDNSRCGVNSQETTLTPANVNTVVKLGNYSLDAPIYTQVLYIPAVTIAAVSRNVLIVGTMGNSVYALDADHVGVILWRASFGAGWSGYPDGGNFYHQTIGILGTPVVDVAGGYVYAVTVSNTPTYTLRKIDITTGMQAASVTISATVSGSGGGSSGGSLPFTAGSHEQRSPLTLAGGNVYVAFGSDDEAGDKPWHGWIMSYDTATLSQQHVLCLNPNGTGAGIWESGGGMAVDGDGNLYFATGNGDYDGSTSFGQSIVKLNSSLALQDWSTPLDYAATNLVDADLSSGRVMLIPGTSIVTVGSKDGRIWGIDGTNMGHLQGSGATPQVFSVPESITAGAGTGIYGGLFFGNTGYFPTATFPTFAFTFSGTTYNTTAAAQTSASYAQVTMAGSSNSGANPIAWAVTVGSSAYSTQRLATLRAWNPATLAEYWNSGTYGNYAKFAAPTVANGRVYVPTNDSTVVAFGLPSGIVPPSIGWIW